MSQGEAVSRRVKQANKTAHGLGVFCRGLKDHSRAREKIGHGCGPIFNLCRKVD